MDDLRKDYNVQNQKRNYFNLEKGWNKNKQMIKWGISLLLISFLIIKPSIIGNYLGVWINKFYSSFVSSVGIGQTELAWILISALTITAIYKLINWRSRD